VTGAIDALRERAEAIFGRGFPLAVPLVPGAVGADAYLGEGAQPAGATPSAARQMIARMAVVRSAAARLNATLTCAELTRDATAAFVVHQQPPEPGVRWAALPGVPPGAGFRYWRTCRWVPSRTAQ